MYQDETFLLNRGLCLRMWRDSQIFLCGWSLVFEEFLQIKVFLRAQIGTPGEPLRMVPDGCLYGLIFGIEDMFIKP